MNFLRRNKTGPPNRAARRAAASNRTSVSRAALTIAEFCASHGFSRAMFYKLMAQGLGPETFRVGRKVLISAEAAARWRRQRTQSARQPAAQPGQQS